MIWRSKYKSLKKKKKKSLLNYFIDLAPPTQLSHLKSETKARTGVQTVCFGDDFWKQELDDGEWDREQVKSIVRMHSWNHC